MSQAPASSSPVDPHANPEGSVRETLEAIVIAFVLAFVFRAFVVEAFIIPTGSMAPTLLGQHSRVTCSQCGYRFTVGHTNGSVDVAAVPCPMCQWNNGLRANPADSGDRILVLKYVYRFSEPRRWDVVVFKNPKEPEVNYIKRLVGLPGEQLWLVDGDVYTRPLAPGDLPPPAEVAWNIQRKTDRVQREVWQPVYHSEYQPLDGGQDASGRSVGWSMPWRATGPTAGQWSTDHNGLRWRYEDKDLRPGELDFAFTQPESRRPSHWANHYYAYNSGTRGRLMQSANTIADLRIAATFTPLGQGLRVTLTGGGRDLLARGVIEADGKAVIQTVGRSADQPDADRGGAGAEWKTVAQGQAGALAAGQSTEVELWHVDHAVSLWVAGRKIAEWAYDRDPQALYNDPGPRLAPVARLSVQGPAVRVRSIHLDRDLYYTPDGTLGIHTPASIETDRFFCLGDNSPQSADSRAWDGVDPWVEDLTGVRMGFVPRELMIGRAFFVYWPAMWRYKGDSWLAVVPNFGKMRFIR
jgi:signal peptidase I